MKNVISKVLTVLVVLVLSVSCSDTGSSFKKNEYIGNVPAIVAEYNEAKAKLDAEGEKKGKDLKDREALAKAMKDFIEKEKAIKQKMEEGLEKASAELKGKELPVVNENPAVEVASMAVDRINDKYVYFKGNVTVKKTLEYSTSAKYQLQNKEGNVIQEGNADINAPYQFGTTNVGEGTYEISVKISLPDPNADKLAKVVFIP